MNETNDPNDLLKYAMINLPSEMEIDTESIYLREKYKEIINYTKLLLTDSSELEIGKYFTRRGNIYIKINRGSDLIQYLKLICSNFYLNFIQLRESAILTDPDAFLKDFEKLIRNICLFENKSKETAQKSEKNKKLLVINFTAEVNDLINISKLLNRFITLYREKKEIQDLIKQNLILIWVNQNGEDLISDFEEFYTIFDLVIKIPLINDSDRREILRTFLEHNGNISFDVERIVELTQNWEVNEIKTLIKTGILKHFLYSELNSKTNEITDIISKIIESREIIPSHSIKLSEIEDNNHKETLRYNILQMDDNLKYKKNKKTNEFEILKDEIKEYTYSEFMLNQLYENAASENYNELVLLLDKLENEEHIETNERSLLAKFPFILQDPPKKAQIYLEKAKKRIDLMKKTFGK